MCLTSVRVHVFHAKLAPSLSSFIATQLNLLTSPSPSPLLQCGAAYKDSDVITICPTAEELAKLQEAMKERRRLAKLAKVGRSLCGFGCFIC